MIFGLPGTDTKIRLFEPVETVDTQYNIVDVGLQYSNDAIDSVAVGGSFHTAKNWMGQLESQKEERKADEAELAQFRKERAENSVAKPDATHPQEEAPTSETKVGATAN